MKQYLIVLLLVIATFGRGPKRLSINETVRIRKMNATNVDSNPNLIRVSDPMTIMKTKDFVNS